MSEEFYVVEQILDKKIIGKVLKYKVKWEGFPLQEATWEPLENLGNVDDLLMIFEEK